MWNVGGKDLMKNCRYCKNGASHVIYSKGILDPNFMDAWLIALENGLVEDIDANIVFEVKNGIGYLKINEHNEYVVEDDPAKTEVSNCLVCGRKL